MDNQHRQIKGYRELTQEQIDLMNKVKTTGAQLEELIAELRTNMSQQFDALSKMEGAEREVEYSRLIRANPYGWINSAEMELQVALMKLTRSVAQPTFF